MLTVMLIGFSVVSLAQRQRSYDAIYSSIPWFDEKGNVLNAHGACILKDNNKYYFFGGRHSDTSNAFVGFNYYSSTDLYNWKFESIGLPIKVSKPNFSERQLYFNGIGHRRTLVLGEKSGKRTGSKGNFVSVDTIVVNV